MSNYVVSDGSDRRDYFESLKEAKAVTWSMALEYAEYERISADELEEWGDSPESGWGVCPAGDTGAFWPQVSYIGPGDEEEE